LGGKKKTIDGGAPRAMVYPMSATSTQVIFGVKGEREGRISDPRTWSNDIQRTTKTYSPGEIVWRSQHNERKREPHFVLYYAGDATAPGEASRQLALGGTGKDIPSGWGSWRETRRLKLRRRGAPTLDRCYPLHGSINQEKATKGFPRHVTGLNLDCRGRG